MAGLNRSEAVLTLFKKLKTELPENHTLNLRPKKLKTIQFQLRASLSFLIWTIPICIVIGYFSTWSTGLFMLYILLLANLVNSADYNYNMYIVSKYYEGTPKLLQCEDFYQLTKKLFEEINGAQDFKSYYNKVMDKYNLEILVLEYENTWEKPSNIVLSVFYWGFLVICAIILLFLLNYEQSLGIDFVMIILLFVFFFVLSEGVDLQIWKYHLNINSPWHNSFIKTKLLKQIIVGHLEQILL